MRPFLVYESTVQWIYVIDIWVYHILTYLVYNNSWDNLPKFTWTSSFWILAALSMLLWTCMVLYRASGGVTDWKRPPDNIEMFLWFLTSLFVHSIFFYRLAFYAKKWGWYIAITLYRIWSARQMLAFFQEVQEKMVLLQASGAAGKRNRKM